MSASNRSCQAALQRGVDRLWRVGPQNSPWWTSKRSALERRARSKSCSAAVTPVASCLNGLVPGTCRPLGQ